VWVGDGVPGEEWVRGGLCLSTGPGYVIPSGVLGRTGLVLAGIIYESELPEKSGNVVLRSPRKTKIN